MNAMSAATASQTVPYTSRRTAVFAENVPTIVTYVTEASGRTRAADRAP